MGGAIEEVPPIRPCWQIMGTKAIILIIIILSIMSTIIITMVRRPSAGWAKVVGNHMNGLIQQENHKQYFWPRFDALRYALRFFSKARVWVREQKRDRRAYIRFGNFARI